MSLLSGSIAPTTHIYLPKLSCKKRDSSIDTIDSKEGRLQFDANDIHVLNNQKYNAVYLLICF